MHTVTTTKEKTPTKKSTAENDSTDVGVYLTTVEAAKYLKLSRHPVGLLMNFNVVALKYGLRRLTLRNSDLLIS